MSPEATVDRTFCRVGALKHLANVTSLTVGLAAWLRLALLKVKADLERELGRSLNCTKCGLDVHWVSGLGITPGHWSHTEPARTTTSGLGRISRRRSRSDEPTLLMVPSERSATTPAEPFDQLVTSSIFQISPPRVTT